MASPEVGSPLPQADSSAPGYSSSSSSSSADGRPANSSDYITSFWRQGFCWLSSSADPFSRTSQPSICSSTSAGAASVAAGTDSKSVRSCRAIERAEYTCEDPLFKERQITGGQRRIYPCDAKAQTQASGDSPPFGGDISCSHEPLSCSGPTSGLCLNYASMDVRGAERTTSLPHTSESASAVEDCPLPTVFVCLVLALLLADALQQLRNKRISQLLVSVGSSFFQRSTKVLFCVSSRLSRHRGTHAEPLVVDAVCARKEQKERDRVTHMAKERLLKGQQRTRRSEDHTAHKTIGEPEKERQMSEEQREEEKEAPQGDQKRAKKDQGFPAEALQEHAEAAAAAAAEPREKEVGEVAKTNGHHTSAEGQQEQEEICPAASTAGEHTKDNEVTEIRSSAVSECTSNALEAAERGKGHGREAEDTNSSAAAIRKKIAALQQEIAKASSSVTSNFVSCSMLQRKIIRLQLKLESLERKEKKGETGVTDREEAKGGKAAAAAGVNTEGVLSNVVKQCMHKLLRILCSFVLKASHRSQAVISGEWRVASY